MIEHVTQDYLKHVYVINPSAGGSSGGGSTIGPDASRPAPGTDGAIYYTTNGDVFFRDNGVSWQAFGPIYTLTDPNAPTWIWYNQGAASIITRNGERVLTMPTQASSQRGQYFTISPPYNVDFIFNYISRGANVTAGVFFTDGTKMERLFFNNNQGVTHGIQTFADGNTFNSNVLSQTYNTQTSPIFCRLSDDGVTNRSYYFSSNGLDWMKLIDVGRTTYLTATGVGFFGDGFSSDNVPFMLNLLSVKIS